MRNAAIGVVAVTCFAGALAVGGCGGGKPTLTGASGGPKKSPLATPHRGAEGVELVRSADTDIVVAVNGRTAFFAWGVNGDNHMQLLVGREMDMKSGIMSSPMELGRRRQESSTLVVEPAGTSFLIAFDETLVDESSFYLARPNETATKIAWKRKGVESPALLHSGSQFFLLWSEPPSGNPGEDLRDVLGVAIDSELRPLGAPATLVRGISGWKAAMQKEEIAVATVKNAPPGSQNRTPGVVTWQTFDSTLVRRSKHAAPQGVVSGGFDLRYSDAVSIGYTTQLRFDHQGIILDEHGEHPVQTDGSNEFVAFGPGSALFTRNLEPDRNCVEVSIESKVLPICFKDEPDVRFTGESYAVLGTISPCEAPCAASSFLTTDAHGELRGFKHVTRGDTPVSASHLFCHEAVCRSIVSSDKGYFVLPLEIEPAHADPPPAQPWTRKALQTTAVGVPFSQYTVANHPTDPKKSVWSARILDDRMAKLQESRLFAGPDGKESLITSRARAEGGLALVRGVNGGIVVWIGNELGDPQVHVTHLDQFGKKDSELVATTEPGEARDVNAAWVGDGWIVTWIDTRDGNGEVYAVKVGTNMRLLTPQIRVTKSPAEASDLTMAARGKDIVLAWTEATGTSSSGDVHLAHLSPKDATLIGAVEVAERSPARSTTPTLALADDGLTLGWIENAFGDTKPRAVVQKRPHGGTPTIGQIFETNERGIPVALMLIADTSAVRILLARSKSKVILEAGTLGDVQLFPVTELAGPPSQSILWQSYSASRFGFADEAPAVGMSGPGQSLRIRTFEIDWGR